MLKTTPTKRQRTPEETMELENYLNRIVKRLCNDLRRYGFTWQQLVSAYKLPELDKKQLDASWMAYYKGKTTTRPSRPNPCEYQEYLEYLRVENLLQDPRVKVVEAIFA